jgi:RNA polymerase II C-terminal domain phosphatase-like 3/4
MADPAPSAAESSGDELEALLMAELEDDAAEADTDAPPSPKRQKTGGERLAVAHPLSSSVLSNPFFLYYTAPSKRGGGCPPHPGYMGGICIRCGALKPEADVRDVGTSGERPPGGSPIALRYIHHGLEVSREEAARLRASTVSRSLASRRLLLILDLDHTLLHSTRFSDLSAEQEAALLAREAAQEGTPETRLLHRIPYMSMWTKLRPGIREFLAKAHELYDLHVFTMGDKDYAKGMAALLDPGGRLFGGRVASSSDAGPGGVKDVDVLLGAEEMVMIMDDTVGVWPRHRANVVQVERYVYFPGDAARFGRT